MMNSITFRCNIAKMVIRSNIHGTIRMNWWEHNSYGTTRKAMAFRVQTDDLTYSSNRAFPVHMGKALIFCEEDYSTFCWFTSKELDDDGETEFSYVTRYPFRIEVDYSFDELGVTTLIISKDEEIDNIEKLDTL